MDTERVLRVLWADYFPRSPVNKDWLMTEQDWDTNRDPGPMLSLLEAHTLATARKRQLFLCAIARHGLPGRHPVLGPVVAAAEELAGLTGQQMHHAERHRLRLYDCILAAHQADLTADDCQIARLACEALCTSKDRWALRARSACGPEVLTDWLREVFGNPCRKVRRVNARLYQRVRSWPAERQPADLLFVRDWLHWQDHLAVRMAETIEQERAWEQLPILADVLEDAGCGERRVLDHLRGPDPHARGCWVLDLILGKE